MTPAATAAKRPSHPRSHWAIRCRMLVILALDAASTAILAPALSRRIMKMLFRFADEAGIVVLEHKGCG
jgi:hypothetical protein